jgi:PmbA protein
MEKLLELACRRADQVEVMTGAMKSDDVSYEDSKLKDIESKLRTGVWLRLIKDGKLGMAFTRNLIDRDELVANALATLKGGVAAEYDLPGTASLPALHAFDPAVDKLTNTQMVDECERVCRELGKRAPGQVNVGAGRMTQRIRLLNSRGADLQAEFSGYGCYAALVFAGSYATINRYVDAKAFAAFPDSTISHIADAYKAGATEKSCGKAKMKVLFLPEAMYALVWRLIEATNAKNVYEKTSPIKDKTGTRIFSELLTVADEPLNDAFSGARAFDDEGTPCRNTAIVEQGVLKGFYCDRRYAQKLGIAPTGNGWRGEASGKIAPGLGHLTIKPGDRTFSQLVGMMDRGIIACGVMGAHSGNILNGDYSVGLCPGLLVEGGKIVGRVKDIMIAGNIYETLQNVVALEDAVHPAQMGRFPAVLCNGVSVAG